MHRVTLLCPPYADQVRPQEWAPQGVLLQHSGFGLLPVHASKPGVTALQQVVATGALTPGQAADLQQHLSALCHTSHPNVVPVYGTLEDIDSLPTWLTPRQPAGIKGAAGAHDKPSSAGAPKPTAAPAGGSTEGAAAAASSSSGPEAVAVLTALPSKGMLLYPHVSPTPVDAVPASSSRSSSLGGASDTRPSHDTLHPGPPPRAAAAAAGGGTGSKQKGAPASSPGLSPALPPSITERQLVLHHLWGLIRALEHLRARTVLPCCITPAQLWRGDLPGTSSTKGSSSSSGKGEGCPTVVQLLPLVVTPAQQEGFLLGLAAAYHPGDVQYLAPELLAPLLALQRLQQQQQGRQQQEEGKAGGPQRSDSPGRRVNRDQGADSDVPARSSQQEVGEDQEEEEGEEEDQQQQEMDEGGGGAGGRGRRSRLARRGRPTQEGWLRRQLQHVDSEKSVVWSLGVLAHLLMLGRLPFTPSPPSAAAEGPASSASQPMASHLLADMGSRCRRGFKFPLWLSDGAKDFITAALAFDPVKRLSLGAALDHPWVLALSFTPANAVDRYAYSMRSTGGGYEITRDNAAELSAAQGAELSQPVGAEGLLRQRAAMRVVPTTPPAAAPAPTAAAAEAAAPAAAPPPVPAPAAPVRTSSSSSRQQQPPPAATRTPSSSSAASNSGTAPSRPLASPSRKGDAAGLPAVGTVSSTGRRKGPGTLGGSEEEGAGVNTSPGQPVTRKWTTAPLVPKTFEEFAHGRGPGAIKVAGARTSEAGAPASPTPAAVGLAHATIIAPSLPPAAAPAGGAPKGAVKRPPQQQERHSRDT